MLSIIFETIALVVCVCWLFADPKRAVGLAALIAVIAWLW